VTLEKLWVREDFSMKMKMICMLWNTVNKPEGNIYHWIREEDLKSEWDLQIDRVRVLFRFTLPFFLHKQAQLPNIQ
jgi:hypothetical protein